MVKKSEHDFIGNAEVLEAISKGISQAQKSAAGYSDSIKDATKWMKELDKLTRTVNLQKAINIDKGIKELTKRMEKMVDASLKLGEKTIEYGQRYNDRILRETKAYDERSHMMQDRMKLDNDNKRGQEQQRADNIMAHSNAISERRLKEEEMKTGRARTSMIKKIMGGFAGGDLFGGLETGAGLAVGAGMTGSELGGERIKKGFGVSKRILNFQQGISGGGETSIGTPVGTPLNKFGSFFSKFPALQKAMGGEKGSEGGGIIGKAGKGAGKLGGIAPLLAGGAAGLIGGIIMKGLESSPMFKAMSKIIGQAFSLYLRPIGDLVGGVFKPLIVPMMKMAAANAKAGSKLIKTGENIGKGLVAVFSNPAGFINAAILDAIDGMHAAISEMLHPVYVALNSMTWGLTAIPEKFTATENRLGTFIDDTYAQWVADIDKAFGSIISSGEETTQVMSGIGLSIQTSQDKTNDILAKEYTILEEQLTVAGYMASLMPNMTETEKDAYRQFAGTGWSRSEVGQATGLFDEEGNLIKEELAETGTLLGTATEDLQESLETTVDTINDTAEHVSKETSKIDSTFTGSAMAAEEQADKQLILQQNTTAHAITISIMFEQAADQIKKRLDSLIARQIKARTTISATGKVNEGRADKELVTAQTALEVAPVTIDMQQQYADISGKMAIIQRKNEIEKQRKQMQEKVNTAARNYALQGGQRGIPFAERQAKLYAAAVGGHISMNTYETIVAKMEKDMIGSAGKVNISTKGASILRAVQVAKDKGILGHTTSPTRMAEGGIINEPVFGVGRSGRSYLLGESGAERVTPLNSSEGGVSVVINIAKMSNTVDLQQIKPIIERALRESHSRRGII